MSSRHKSEGQFHLGLIGSPIKHSASPAMHEAAAASLRLKPSYLDVAHGVDAFVPFTGVERSPQLMSEAFDAAIDLRTKAAGAFS